MINIKLEKKREADRKSYWKRRILSAGLEFDPMLTSAQLKAVFYEVTNKLPRKKKPKPVKTEGDHLSDQYYLAIEELSKEEERQKGILRDQIPEGISSLIRDRGGDEIPISVIFGTKIDLDHYLVTIRKKEKEKAKKSSWRIWGSC